VPHLSMGRYDGRCSCGLHVAPGMGDHMVYVCEFEFWRSPEGNVIAEPLSVDCEGTFGEDLPDAVASAADWLSMFVDDYLMEGAEPPEASLGNEPRHGGRVIAVAVSRELGDIPAMTTAEAARELGVSCDGIARMRASGLLESWRVGSRLMVSRSSVEARKGDVASG
jgi:excisionase family DNA binding protein